MSDSANLDAILAVLSGQKVYDSASGKWRVYDAYGAEIVDTGGVLLTGLHGFLLNNQTEQQTYFASLGWTSNRQKKRDEEEIEEPISAKSITRIRNELLSEVLANDLISRAKRRKAQAEEALFLLLI